MLSAFRAFAKSPWAIAMFVVLIFSFSVWGIRDGLHAKISDWVVAAGSRQVSANDFKNQFETIKKHFEEQQGEAVPLKALLAQGADKELLDQRAGEQAFAEYLHRIGVRPANSLMSDALLKIPDFFNQATGKFDPKLYGDVLQNNHLTKDKFETELLDEIAQQHFRIGLAASLKAPRAYAALVAAYQYERRDVSFIKIDPTNVPTVTPPSDTQLTAFIKERGMTLPEMRTLTVVRFSAKAMADKATVDPAAVKKLFDYNRGSIEQPETRSLTVIPARDPATAQALMAMIKSGKPPELAAKAAGAQPINYKDTPKGGVADSKVADAAFSMKAGEVGAVQGSLGNAVVYVGGVTPAVTADFEKMRPQLEAKVRASSAAQLAYAAFEKYDDAHTSGASLADAAKAAGVTPVDVGPIGAQGFVLSKQPEGVLTQRVLKVAFGLAQGDESAVQDEGGGEYFVVKVDKIAPPRPPAVNDIRSELTKGYIQLETMKRMEAMAQDVINKTGKGMSLDAAASSVGLKVEHATGLSRATPAGYKPFGQSVARALFSAKVGQVFAGRTAEQGPASVMVAKVDAISAAPLAEASGAAGTYVTPLSKQLFEDADQTTKKFARDQIKPKIDLPRARAAIGATTADEPPAPADVKRGKLAQ